MLPKTSNEYQECYDKAEVNSVLLPQIKSVCGKIFDQKKRYQEVEAATKVPWYLIGAIHYRESSLNFNCFLHNGDPLHAWNGKGLQTVHVPIGVGPFSSWQSSAIDAITREGLEAPKTVGECLLFAERYNGMGYHKRGVMSPYVWAGTSLYSGGKYVADGKFDPLKFDRQLGVCCLLKTLLAAEEKIKSNPA